jgi:peroxiredoxin
VSDVTGKETTLAGVFAQRPVVLVFYRGGWCPYCNFQLHELATKGEELRKRGVVVVAISVDKPQYGAKTAQEHAAAFEVLSDPDLVAHKAFRVVNHIGGATAFALARMGEDLETRSGRDHHDVAVPAIFLIDRAGIIRWAHTDPDYKRRPSATAVLEAIDASDLAKGSAETPKQLPAPTGP